MKVTLLAHTPNPEITIAAAAKLCYSPAEIDTLLSGLSQEKASDFVEMLGEIGHESPIEHAVFTFGIEGVSRSLLAQITRHRMASFSVQSQRYVREAAFAYVVPPQIAENPEAQAEFIRAMEEDQQHYQRITAILKAQRLQENLEAGMEEKAAARAAEKTAIEDARFVLPNACETKMILTMNARSLQNFFRHRCCNRAQWEIRALAREMLGLVRQAAPTLFGKSGPPCLHGPCPEGKMSCGRLQQVREEYRALGQGESVQLKRLNKLLDLCNSYVDGKFDNLEFQSRLCTALLPEPETEAGRKMIKTIEFACEELERVIYCIGKDNNAEGIEIANTIIATIKEYL